MTIISINRAEPTSETRCLCGAMLQPSRDRAARTGFLHASTGKFACYPQSLNPEDASYYVASPAEPAALFQQATA